MKKVLLITILTVASTFPMSAQELHSTAGINGIPVTVLGTFHFAYPNLDRIATGKENQVDILSMDRQAELREVLDRIKRFRPTIIAVEVPVEDQPRIDSLYAEYLNGRYDPGVAEQYQIGFRLARELRIGKVHCIDTWGDYERYMDRDTFWTRYEAYMDSNPVPEYDQWSQELSNAPSRMTLLDYYRMANSDSTLSKMQSGYFLSNFLFEEQEHDYAGVDWVTAQWYNRNLRIIRNLMRIRVTDSDRILVIYGNGHHALLRDYLGYTPLFRYESITDYLK